MAEYEEGNYLGDVILSEEDIRYSRERVTVITGQDLTISNRIIIIVKSV